MPNATNPNFRKTQAGIKLGKALFSKNAQTKITPTQITQLLKQAGVNVPPSVVVTADVAQIIMAGGAFVSAINSGASIGAYANPTAATVSAVMDLMTVTGLIDAKSSAAQLAKYGAETALVVSSAGTNVAADIAFALDTYQQISKGTRGAIATGIEAFSGGMFITALDEMIFGSSRLKDLTGELRASANAVSKNVVIKDFQSKYAPQAAEAASNFLEFNRGKISVFELMGKTAEKDPLAFYNYFPQLKVFLPPHFLKLSVSTTVNYTQEGGMFSLAKRDYTITGSYEQTFETAEFYSRDQIIEAIINYFLSDSGAGMFNFIQSFNPKEPLIPNENIRPERRIEMGDLACLSMFPPYFERIDSGLNLSAILNNLSLTPHDMGYEFIEDMKTNFHIFPELKSAIASRPAVTFNGIDYFSAYQVEVNKVLKAKQALVEQLIKWDIEGDAKSLTKNATGNKMVCLWGDTYGQMIEEIKKTKAKIDSQAINQGMQYLEPLKNIRNFFSIMSFVEFMRNDKYISSTEQSRKSINDKINYMTGLSSSMEERYKELQFLSVSRKMNVNAKDVIASFFNTTADKIKFAKTEQGQLGYVL